MYNTPPYHNPHNGNCPLNSAGWCASVPPYCTCGQFTTVCVQNTPVMDTKPRHQEVRHGDAVFIVVSPDTNHLKIAKGMRIYEISLH